MMIVNKKIGDMTESELKDFIIELQEKNSRYERINEKYKEVIEKAIDFIDYYMCDDYEYIGYVDKVKDILKGVE